MFEIQFRKGLNFMEDINVGIDLGGSHVAIGIVDKNGKILDQYEKDFTVEEKKDLINVATKYIIENINMLKKQYSFSKFGIGVAGAISNGIILKSVNLGIVNYNIKQKLEEATKVKVIVKNDAKCAAIAEYKFGDCNKYQNVLFLTLGTGIGGSYIYQGNLMTGNSFEGFEFGHMIIKAGGVPCRCGKNGCFERYGSILQYKNKVKERLNIPREINSQPLRDIMNPRADEIEDLRQEYLNDLSLGISNLINIFEPDLIVLGGGFTHFAYMFMDDLKSKIVKSNLLFNRREDIDLRVATLENDAAMIGCVM